MTIEAIMMAMVILACTGAAMYLAILSDPTLNKKKR